MPFDQDAVDEALRILQPQIDELKARSTGRRVVEQVLTYDNGDVEVWVPALPTVVT